MPNQELLQKLYRQDCGLACSIHRTDLENVEVIETILFAYKSNLRIEAQHRTGGDNWETVVSCPTDFTNLVYRIANNEN